MLVDLAATGVVLAAIVAVFFLQLQKLAPQVRSLAWLALLERLAVIVCLGGFAWEVAFRALAALGIATPKPRPRFGHDVLYEDSVWLPLLGCFHPSQQNTFTGRLTPAMIDAVLAHAIDLADGR